MDVPGQQAQFPAHVLKAELTRQLADLFVGDPGFILEPGANGHMLGGQPPVRDDQGSVRTGLDVKLDEPAIRQDEGRIKPESSLPGTRSTRSAKAPMNLALITWGSRLIGMFIPHPSSFNRVK